MDGLVLLPLSAQAFNAGDTVEVDVSFSYQVGAPTTIYLYACPYQVGAVLQHHNLFQACLSYSPVTLDKALTTTSKTASVTFPILPYSQGGPGNGTWGLAVWLRKTMYTSTPATPDSDMSAEMDQDDALTVSGDTSASGSTPGLTDTLTAMMPMLLMLMMVGMMAPMMQGFGEGDESQPPDKEVIEEVPAA